MHPTITDYDLKNELFYLRQIRFFKLSLLLRASQLLSQHSPQVSTAPYRGLGPHLLVPDSSLSIQEAYLRKLSVPLGASVGKLLLARLDARLRIVPRQRL